MPLAYLFSRYPVVSQTFCDSEMLALERLGRSLVVASLNPPNTSFRHERLRELRAEVVYPPPPPLVKSIVLPPGMAALADDHEARYGRTFKAAIRARNAAWLAPALARRGVRHVHVHFANRATHTALFLKRAGFTFSFTAHAQDYMVDLGSDELLRELAREAEFVIAVSDFSRDDLRRRCPERAGAIHRIYNGVRPDDFPPAAPDRPGPLRIVTVGRLIEFKGFHDLVDAMGLLRDRGVPATLDIIGDGPWRDQITNRIDQLGLADCVQLSGVLSQETIKQRLAASDVFALACCVDAKGASDILPTVIMEAMAARLPVVSTRVAGVPEMVDHAVTGLLAPPNDPNALAEALAELAADPDRRARFGHAGRQRCERQFSLALTAATLADTLDAVTSPAGISTPRPPAPTVLALSHCAEESEWPALAPTPTAPDFTVLAAGAGRHRPADWLEYLPDAIVLEAAWRADPAAATTCEALYATLDVVDGESFFRDARRAVHTAAWLRTRGHRHLHAARSHTLLWTWLVKKLTGLPATATIESAPALPAALLTRLVADFDAATVADASLRLTCPHAQDDVLGLTPSAPRRWLFTAPPPPVANLDAFRRLLSLDS